MGRSSPQQRMTVIPLHPGQNIGPFVDKFGYNGAAGTGAEDVVAAGGNAYLPAAVIAAADIDIAGDAQDVAGGTGASAIIIEGLSATGFMQSEEKALNGATDVHPALAYWRIYRAYITGPVGTNETNVGDITIDDGAGNVLAVILAGAGQTLQAVYTVPADYKLAKLLDITIQVISKTAAYGVFDLMFRHLNEGWRVQRRFGVHNTAPLPYKWPMYPEYEPLSDIKVRLIDSTATVPVTAAFNLQLER